MPRPWTNRESDRASIPRGRKMPAAGRCPAPVRAGAIRRPSAARGPGPPGRAGAPTPARPAPASRRTASSPEPPASVTVVARVTIVRPAVSVPVEHDGVDVPQPLRRLRAGQDAETDAPAGRGQERRRRRQPRGTRAGDDRHRDTGRHGRLGAPVGPEPEPGRADGRREDDGGRVRSPRWPGTGPPLSRRRAPRHRWRRVRRGARRAPAPHTTPAGPSSGHSAVRRGVRGGTVRRSPVFSKAAARVSRALSS